MADGDPNWDGDWFARWFSWCRCCRDRRARLWSSARSCTIRPMKASHSNSWSYTTIRRSSKTSAATRSRGASNTRSGRRRSSPPSNTWSSPAIRPHSKPPMGSPECWARIPVGSTMPASESNCPTPTGAWSFPSATTENRPGRQRRAGRGTRWFWPPSGATRTRHRAGSPAVRSAARPAHRTRSRLNPKARRR